MRNLHDVLQCLVLLILLPFGKALKLKSPAFSDGESIPPQFTAMGRDVSPPLQWKKAPQGTTSLALTVDDPDAPDPEHPTRVFVHWVLYNIPSDVHELRQGCSANQGKCKIPGSEGLNDWNKVGYMGPDPPIGRHRYHFTLYALDKALDEFSTPPTKFQLQAAMEGHVLGETRLIGTFQK